MHQRLRAPPDDVFLRMLNSATYPPPPPVHALQDYLKLPDDTSELLAMIKMKEVRRSVFGERTHGQLRSPVGRTPTIDRPAAPPAPRSKTSRSRTLKMACCASTTRPSPPWRGSARRRRRCAASA